MYNPAFQHVRMSHTQAPINPQGNLAGIGRIVDDLSKTPIKKVFGNDRAALLIKESAYDKFAGKSGKHGNPQGKDPGSFVAPSSEMRELLRSSNTWSQVAKKLGFGADYFDDGERVLLLEAHYPLEHNLHWSTKESAGANEYWIPGGRTSGGVTEGFIGIMPQKTITVMSDGEFQTYNHFTIQAVNPGTEAGDPVTPFTTGTTRIPGDE
jgi:hypothetical protein